MNNKFHSKFFVNLSVLFLSLFLVSNTFSEILTLPTQDWEKELKTGIELYNEGQFYDAIQHFNRVLSLTQEESILATVHYNLSACYYYSGNINAAKESMRRLLTLDPLREVPDVFPSKYKKLFSDVKKEFSRESKANIDEEPQEQQILVTPYRSKQGEPKINKKKRKLLLIGGLVLAGGVVAGIFLLTGKDKEPSGSTTGSIQVNSNPQGGQVFLDGTNTGQTTNCTLSDVSPGNHQVKVIKEGYIDYENSVNVVTGDTAQLNFSFDQHTITISGISSDTHLMINENVEITWNTGGVSAQQGAALLQSNISRNSLQTQGVARFFPDYNVQHNISHRNSILRDRNSLDLKSANKSGLRETRNLTNRTLHVQPYSLRNPLLNPNLQPGPQFSYPGGSFNLPFSAFPNQTEYGTDVLSNVKIELYKGGSLNKTIIESTTNDGSHNWTVPSDVSDGSDYKLRISCAQTPDVFSETPLFKITLEKTVRFDSTDTPKIIADNSETTSTINVSQSGTITNLKYHLNFTHTSYNNLVIILFSPDGTFNLIWDKGLNFGGDNVDFEDRISTYNGKETKGNWDLFVKDVLVSDTGQIEWWWIEITYKK